jgi:uncharacterized protein (TIGR02246 family)
MWSLVSVSCFLMGGSLFAADSQQADEAGVRKVIADFAEAWGRHDGKAMAALHTEDVNFINIFGEWWKTRAEVEKNLIRIHSAGGGMAHSTMKTRIEQIEFPAANVAIVHGIVELFNAAATDSRRKPLHPSDCQTARQVAYQQFPKYAYRAPSTHALST